MNVKGGSSIQNLLGDSTDSKKLTPDINQIIKSGKPNKIKKVSLINVEDSVIPVVEEKQHEIHDFQIIIPQPIIAQQEEKYIQKVTEKNQLDEIKKESKKRSKVKNKIVTEQVNQQVKNEIEQIKGVTLPEEINYVEIEEQVDTALNDIPGGDKLDLIDIEITKIPQKDKTGYYKTKVNIKKENIPNQINQIASYVKKQSKGLISPRVCDLRVIGNTNKTQLKSSTLKLSVNTIVFKPDYTKLKVNKGTRFMISVPENYESTGNLIIYIQESRAKKILEISAKEFQSMEIFNEFIGDRIAEYYFSGYEITLKKLELRNVDNPLMSLINKIVETHEYKAKPYVDDSHIYAVDFVSKGSLNQWLIIQVIEADIKNTYKILAKNTADRSWEYQISKNDTTLNQLLKNLYDVLDSCYNKDWSKELQLNSDDDAFYYLYDKLSHSRLKRAMVYLNDIKTENPDLNLIIKETLSKKDTAKSINKDYDAEAIIGKTNYLDYFILSYLAFKVVGGDKRKGSEYITTDEYYDKYNIKNRSDYPERAKTILANQGTQRNYDARIYLFQIEYSSKGIKHVYRNTNWDDLVKETGFLSENVKQPKTIY